MTQKKLVLVSQREFNLYGLDCSDGIKRILKYDSKYGTCLVPCKINKTKNKN